MTNPVFKPSGTCCKNNKATHYIHICPEDKQELNSPTVFIHVAQHENQDTISELSITSSLSTIASRSVCDNGQRF
ncbi:hypothetical protein DERP_011299, partial [Dermatophagoides pteronyssinus]